MNYSMGLEVVGLFKVDRKSRDGGASDFTLNGDNTNYIKHQFGLVDLM
jgi:hypothetical protein